MTAYQVSAAPSSSFVVALAAGTLNLSDSEALDKVEAARNAVATQAQDDAARLAESFQKYMAQARASMQEMDQRIALLEAEKVVRDKAHKDADAADDAAQAAANKKVEVLRVDIGALNTQITHLDATVNKQQQLLNTTSANYYCPPHVLLRAAQAAVRPTTVTIFHSENMH